MAQRRSDIREISSRTPRGVSRPIGAGYILAAYPYPFGEKLVAWHVFHSRNPNVWYAVGEAEDFDDALDQADRIFGVDLRRIAAARDPAQARTGRRLSKRQREFIARKIPILMDEGYPQRQAVAIAYRMAGVPRREPRRARRDWSPEPVSLTDTRADRAIAHYPTRREAIRAGQRYERRTGRSWSVCG